jgi:hypothetical protein
LQLVQSLRLSLAVHILVYLHNGGLKVAGLTSDAIGKLAFEANVPIYELAQQTASLEEAFLELTAGSEEFATKVIKKGQK